MIGIGKFAYSAAECAVFCSGHFPPSYSKMQYGEEYKCPLMHRQHFLLKRVSMNH